MDTTGPALPEDRYAERELSWLAFNERVLAQAREPGSIPLLERARFLAIFAQNLDEFFMVRVAGLKRRIEAGVARPRAGFLPRDLHEVILRRTRELVEDQMRLFGTDIRPALAAEGIHILPWTELTTAETDAVRTLFRERIFPVLTPLAVDPSHPFPYISGLSINLAVFLRHPQTGVRQFAGVKVPDLLRRFIGLGDGRFVALEDVIAHHLGHLFAGMQILSHHVFRVTRNEDLEVEEDDAENLLFALEKQLLRRKVGRPPVRLEVERGIDDHALDVLLTELDLTEREVFRVDGPLDLTGLFSLVNAVAREDLSYPAFLPITHPHLAEVETARPADLFTALRSRDVLLHHPYDSFATSVQRFIEQAAADPQVLAIKQTLYRTSGDSPIVDALIEAAQSGKQVLAVVEIKARFDERNNIAWARKLERSGVHVIYGVLGFKTHCKLALVVRDERSGLHRYAHIGTGNYNPTTARSYEDMGLLTANPVITEDVALVFNHLSGTSAETRYRRLLVAPHSIRQGLIEFIGAEVEHHRAGRRARIRIKVNSIVDEAVTDALYAAAQAGVPVDLWVRGICGVRAGVPGLSENIRVRSILGRFLEHSRLFWFDNGGRPRVGLGSCDLMHRNLDRRVEVLVSITNRPHIDQIGAMFDLAFDEATAGWWLTPDGWVARSTGPDGRPLRDLQAHFISATGARRRAKEPL